jgi:hypothetical protein
MLPANTQNFFHSTCFELFLSQLLLQAIFLAGSEENFAAAAAAFAFVVRKSYNFFFIYIFVVAAAAKQSQNSFIENNKQKYSDFLCTKSRERIK